MRRNHWNFHRYRHAPFERHTSNRLFPTSCTPQNRKNRIERYPAPSASKRRKTQRPASTTYQPPDTRATPHTGNRSPWKHFAARRKTASTILAFRTLTQRDTHHTVSDNWSLTSGTMHITHPFQKMPRRPPRRKHGSASAALNSPTSPGVHALPRRAIGVLPEVGAAATLICELRAIPSRRCSSQRC